MIIFHFWITYKTSWYLHSYFQNNTEYFWPCYKYVKYESYLLVTWNDDMILIWKKSVAIRSGDIYNILMATSVNFKIKKFIREKQIPYTANGVTHPSKVFKNHQYRQIIKSMASCKTAVTPLLMVLKVNAKYKYCLMIGWEFWMVDMLWNILTNHISLRYRSAEVIQTSAL